MQNLNIQTVQISIYNSESAYPVKYELKNGETVFAGSGASCGIKLRGAGISQFHCMFEIVDDRLLIHNCDTGGKILVNGKTISDEFTCEFSDTITIGQHEIVLTPMADSAVGELPGQSEAAAPESEAGECATQTFESQDLPCQQELGSQKSGFEEGLPESKGISSVQELESEGLAAEENFDYTMDEVHVTHDENDSWFEEDGDPDSLEVDDLMRDEMELLRSEIEFLHSEMAAKDQEIAELTLGGTSDESADFHETDKLVSRLEELLEELDTSDERVKSLEDLLRLSEEANRAEQEERLQIESWLGEIENRISQRESEQEAEIENLKQRVEASVKLQHKAESQLKQVLAKSKSQDKQPTAGAMEQAAKLQQQLQQTERLLETSREEKQALEQKVNELTAAAEVQVDVELLEQKLIQMELETSRERAAIARDRAELQARMEEMERTDKKIPTLDSDFRFAAMRDHLRELHEEEKLDKIQKQQNSLSGRISRLLKRR